MTEGAQEAFNPTDEARLETARFRYGVIAGIVQGEVCPRELAETVRQLAAQEWTDPDGCKVRFTERTIYNYLKAYRAGGFGGLARRRRSDKGKLRALSEETLQEFVCLREDPPRRSTPALLDIYRLEKPSAKAPTRSTLDRHLDRLGKSRRRMGVLEQKVRRRIVMERVNQLWVGDLHDGPKALHPFLKVPVESHLSAFIDHRSRLIPFGQYYPRENLPVLEDTFRRAVGRRGCPDSIYVDNALIYQSTQFDMACLRLGIQPPIHSKPYDKESRGIIERLNQTVLQDFEREIRALGRIPTFLELNEYWWGWLEEKYHRRVHEETGRAPIDFWQADGFVPRYADPEVLAECFRAHVQRKVDKKTSTVEVQRRSYKVDPELRGRRVDVFYDPFDTEYVVVYYRSNRIQRAYQKEVQPAALKEPSPQVSQTPYLDMLKAAHKRRLRKQAAELAYRGLPSRAEGFSDFVGAFETVLTAPMEANTHDRLEKFWKVYGPVPMDMVNLVLGNALAVGEVGLHVTHYLDHLRRRLRTRRAPGKTDAGSKNTQPREEEEKKS